MIILVLGAVSHLPPISWGWSATRLVSFEFAVTPSALESKFCNTLKCCESDGSGMEHLVGCKL